MLDLYLYEYTVAVRSNNEVPNMKRTASQTMRKGYTCQSSEPYSVGIQGQSYQLAEEVPIQKYIWK